MKRQLLDYLACPSCNSELSLNVLEEEGTEIITGELRCRSCERTYPVRGGIPRFADLEQIEKDKRETAASFGWSWQEFTQDDEKYDEQFLGWIAPVRPDFFES